MTLEELLNKCIQRGWKPRGEEKIHSCRYYEEEKKFKADYTIAWIPQVLYRSIRELVGRESWLLQFVCENRKRWYTIPECWIKNPKICDEWIESVEKECNQNSYEYYIIESALTDESELEQFLLDNIKIDE